MLVSRDGFAPYREAISQASRNIIEVVDRFHLLKNLSDFFEKIFHTLLPGSFGLEVKECTPKIVLTDNDEYYDRWDYLSWRRILDVKKGYENGESVTSIARRFSISRQTVYNDIQRTGTHRKFSPSASRRKANRWIDWIRQHDQESGGRNTQRA
ncbi:MAG: helix-turn-helix domain-containing protein [Psychrobacillus sp.]